MLVFFFLYSFHSAHYLLYIINT